MFSPSTDQIDSSSHATFLLLGKGLVEGEAIQIVLLFSGALNSFEPKTLGFVYCLVYCTQSINCWKCFPPKDSHKLCTILDVEHQDFDGNSYEE